MSLRLGFIARVVGLQRALLCPQVSRAACFGGDNAVMRKPESPVLDPVARVLAASPFVAQQVQNDSGRVAVWLAAPPVPPGSIAGAVADCLVHHDEAAFMQALRRERNASMARIAARALAEVASLDETLSELSELADACCDTAMRYAERPLRQRFGVPRDAAGAEARMIVLGMGKLGGGELNFSSDIDLIFAYTDNGDTDGQGEAAQIIENSEYFARLAKEVARLLATPTGDGFVFRVDTMLRPFGSAGAAAVSVDAMEQYYQLHGREWERYALVKARPCAGDLDAGRQLLLTLRPFVYRRYLDFGAVGALRELKQLIDQDAHKRGAEDNLKLGPGGIRELEFIVQLFQLTRGGQDARLRDPRLRPTLRYLGEAGFLPAATAAKLDDAYVYLRRCENAVQMYADQQTHLLPKEAPARAALCAALAEADWDALMARLSAVRTLVRTEFERLFTAPVAAASDERAPLPAEALWNAELVELEQMLREHGFVQRPQDIAAAIDDLRNARMVRALHDATRDRLRVVIARLLGEAVTQPDPETAAARALKLVSAIAGRSTYLALLQDSAPARHQLVRLSAASPWIAELLAQTPALLDAMLDGRLATEAPDRESLKKELRHRAEGVPVEDMEAVMELLRRYRKEMTLRIAAADLSGALPLVQVSDRLTWLAEAIVAQTLDYARAQMRPQFGEPFNSDGSNTGFAVIAYGKFGSIEMGYGSDLDLVFVYDTDQPDESTVGGTRAIAASDYFARLVQRIVNLLTLQTAAGRAYEIDLELRPSGNSGLVVTRLAGFEKYQRESAWIWEHQALLRARPVTGDARLCAAIAEIRRDVLMSPRDPERLRDEVAQMRTRMRANLEKRVPGHWDVKQGAGGLIDAEFLTQYLCLLHAADHASLVEYTDNWRQLEALAAAALLLESHKTVLLAAERAYRGWLHRRALQQQDALAEDGQFVEERTAVAALWNRYLGE
jgi:glutamate-ammonia-ligase adenylyltransferase